MKKLLAAFLAFVGLAWLRKRTEAPPAAPLPDPAEELRAKLAERRQAEPEAEPAPEAPHEDVDSRRGDVHDRARKAIEDLSGTDTEE